MLSLDDQEFMASKMVDFIYDNIISNNNAYNNNYFNSNNIEDEDIKNKLKTDIFGNKSKLTLREIKNAIKIKYPPANTLSMIDDFNSAMLSDMNEFVRMSKIYDGVEKNAYGIENNFIERLKFFFDKLLFKDPDNYFYEYNEQDEESS